MQTKRLTGEQAAHNAQHYCSYQERCHSEVKDRLFSQGLAAAEIGEIISDLIAKDFLNEERFAKAFVRGKFRMNGWGKVKIRYALRSRKVSEYCINKGLCELDDDEYERTLKRLFDDKWNLLSKEKNVFVKKKKVVDYLTQKGYERDIIFDLLKQN